MASDAKHKQAPILYKGQVIFHVDKKLQSLIQFYLDHGIETFNSCEDNVKGKCWIEYALEDWMAIVESAFSEGSRDLYEFIEEECQVLLLNSDDGHLDENDEYWIEGENLVWSASVRFAKKLIPKFEALVRAHIETLKQGQRQSGEESGDAERPA